MRGVILYGPPACGKDTITTALHDVDPRYVQFPRLKVGAGRTSGYRMTTDAVLDALRAANAVVWENRRYGAVYAVDEPGLRAQLAEKISVVHLGQVEAVEAVRAAVPDATWTVVCLWCPREIAEERATKRGTGDVEERLRAWDETSPLADADLFLNTAEDTPENAALRIDDLVQRFGTTSAGE